MPWLNSTASWPASAKAITNAADTVLSQVGAAMSGAVSRITAVNSKVSYTKHDLSSDAQALLSLRTDLNNLLANAKTLTVTPSVFAHGDNGYLSAQAAINGLIAKLTDNADAHLPQNQTKALVLLLSASSGAQLLSQLTPICNLLALPSLMAYQRQLKKSLTLADDKMQQNKAALTPRWAQAHALNLQPLRNMASIAGQQIAQLETLSSDAQTPLSKLTALANKRTAMLEQLKTDLADLEQVAGKIWRFSYTGNAQQLAIALQTAALPVNEPVSVAVVISSSQPITFFEELL